MAPTFITLPTTGSLSRTCLLLKRSWSSTRAAGSLTGLCFPPGVVPYLLRDMPNQQALKYLHGTLVQTLRNANTLVNGANPKPLFEVLALVEIHGQAQQVAPLSFIESSDAGLITNDVVEFFEPG